MSANEAVDQIRTLRQARLFHPDAVPTEVVDQLLEVARWSGSSRNTQPWHFIVVTDKATLKTLSEARPPINWVADVPLAIALVMNGVDPESEGYDEGRVTERILIAATLLGYGGGTAWFMDEHQQQIAREALGVPAEKMVRSLVAIGKPTTFIDPRTNWNPTGRKRMSEILSYETYSG